MVENQITLKLVEDDKEQQEFGTYASSMISYYKNLLSTVGLLT